MKKVSIFLLIGVQTLYAELAIPLVGYTACNKPLTLEVIQHLGGKGRIRSVGTPRAGRVKYTSKLITYVPTKLEEEVDTFSYMVEGSDGTQSTSVIMIAKKVSGTVLNEVVTGTGIPIVVNALGDVCDTKDIKITGIAQKAAYGTVSYSAHAVTYISYAEFTGQDTFTYKALVKGKERKIKVTVHVVAIAPDAQLECKQGTSLLFGITSDEGLRPHIMVSPRQGTLTVLDGGRALLYEPNKQFKGKDRFVYTLQTLSGQTGAGVVNVTVL